MKGWWQVVVCMFVLLLPVGVMAQHNTLLTRQQLDSLMNSPQSTQSAGALVAESKLIDLGTIEVEDMINFSFELRNTTAKTITITELRASCSCIKLLTKPTVVEPNGALKVDGRFNPAGRNSSFRYTIKVYTELDSQRPTEQVTVTGDVLCSDKWYYLPEKAGALRLSRKWVTIEGSGRERIAVANSSDKPLKITARSTVAGLTLRCEPEILEPQSEGNIYISYSNETATELNTMLILEGVDATPSERMIKVTIKR